MGENLREVIRNASGGRGDVEYCYDAKSCRIWLDDLRPEPPGYICVKSVNEAIRLIEKIEEEGGAVELLDLDHDLGDYAAEGGDAICLLDWLVMRETFYPVVLHTANPVGRANMERMIARFWPDE